MKLHIFNPEHDLAMASHLANFTAPHAGRALRADLCFLPGLWAEEGDAVLVDDADYAAKAFRRFLTAARLRRPMPQWLTKQELAHSDISVVEPWGWDKAIRFQLERNGVKSSVLPSPDEIEVIRNLSHRRVAAETLRNIQMEGTTGESFECSTSDEIWEIINSYGQVVLKAPWSSSGRGIRFVDVMGKKEKEQAQNVRGWVKNTLQVQGSIMVEPYYNMVKDFAMEFYSDGMGQIDYLGLSLFHTANGAYTGNILATEEEKKEILSHYISIDLVENIKVNVQAVLGQLFRDKYCGPFGIDMMVVASRPQKTGRGPEDNLLHPCVEINLRRTMGHVALCLSPTEPSPMRVMRICMEGHYKIRVRTQQKGVR